MVTVATPDQSGEVRTLARQAGIRPTTTSVRPGDATITALTGPAAPRWFVPETPGDRRGRQPAPRRN